MKEIAVALGSDNKVWIYGFNEERFNSFLGKLLTLAETLGLPKSQEDAYKSLIKQEVWHLWEHAPFIEQKEWQVGATTGS